MIYWLGSRGGTPCDKLGGALPEEESRGLFLCALRLDVALAPLEPSPSAELAAAMAAEWSPLALMMPPTEPPMLGMFTRWLMLLLLMLLLWEEWSDEGCEYDPVEGARELTPLLSTQV